MISGVILAGGRGERMGAFKPLLPWRGRPLVAYAIDALAPLCGEIVIMAGPRAADLVRAAPWGTYTVRTPRVLADPGEGPHVALRLAAEAARGDPILVAPADSPRLTADLYARLLAAGPDARFVVEGIADPLVACYHRETLRTFQGRSLQQIPARGLDAGPWAAQLRDLDEPSDLLR